MAGKPAWLKRLNVGDVSPTITDSHRLGNLRTAYDDGIALKLRSGFDEFLVFTGNGEAFEFAILRDQSAAFMGEAEDGTGAIEFDGLINRAGVLQLFAVGHRTGRQRQSRANGLLVRRVDIGGIAAIGGHDHGRVARALPGNQLRFADFRAHPVPRGNLHEKKRELALAPLLAPVGDQGREKRAV